MIVVEKKPVPIYETECGECHSKIRYQKCEVDFGGYIACPVCGVLVWASTVHPVEMKEET